MKKKIKLVDGSILEVEDNYQLKNGEIWINDLPQSVGQPVDITAGLQPVFENLSATLSDQLRLMQVDLKKQFNDEIAKLVQKPVEIKPFASNSNESMQMAHVGDDGIARRIKNIKPKANDEYVRWCKGLALANREGQYGLIKALNAGDLQLADVMIEGTVGLGGVKVPELFDLDVIEETGKYSNFLNYINFKTANVFPVNLAGTATGMTAYVVGENVSSTLSNKTWNPPTVSDKMIVVEATLSRQMLMDAVGIAQELASGAAEARAKKLEFEIIRGATLCTGFMSLSNPQVEPVNGTLLTWQDFNNLISTIFQWRRNQGIWLMHPITAGLVRGITDDQNRPIFQNPAELPEGKIFGAPVIENYNMIAPADVESGTKYIAFIVPDRVVWAYRHVSGMSIETVTSGLDSASNNRDSNFLATTYLRERLGITNYASLDSDGENHVFGVMQAA